MLWNLKNEDRFQNQSTFVCFQEKDHSWGMFLFPGSRISCLGQHLPPLETINDFRVSSSPEALLKADYARLSRVCPAVDMICLSPLSFLASSISPSHLSKFYFWGFSCKVSWWCFCDHLKTLGLTSYSFC